MYDSNNDGMISLEEFKQIVKQSLEKNAKELGIE